MEEKQVKDVAIIGAGLMGLGIGVEFARFGYNVRLYNTKKETSDRAMKRAAEDLDLMVKMQLISRDTAKGAYSRLCPTTDIKEAATGAHYVVEAVLEILSLKQDIFAQLDEICPPPAILCTDTSGLRVTDIAAKAKHPERILATHYVQPPHFVPLVEVVGGERTDKKLVESVAGMLRKMRKRVLVIGVDTPSFIMNRIQGAIGREIQNLIAEGLGTPEMIDDAIIFGFGRRMGYTGYFKRQDLIGLDFPYTSAKARGREPWKLIAERVERGELGMKSGKGFYDWPQEKQDDFLFRVNTELIRLLKQDMERGDI